MTRLAIALLAILAIGGCDSKDAAKPAAGATGKTSSLDRFEPDPRHPERDRSAMQDDGCLVKTDDSQVKRCVYGDADSAKTVVLFGDSLAMAYFPALDVLAERHGWRLVTFTKMGCPPVAAPLYSHRRDRTYFECAEWRQRALGEIERERGVAMIFVTGRMSTLATRDGETLGERRSRAVLERGYGDVLKRLVATGARVVALKDLPSSPRNGPDCIVAHPNDLDECSFAVSPENAVGFDRVAAQSVSGVELIDMTPQICPRGVCQVAIDGKVVFRDFDHMTPTFARTLARPIERALGDLR